MRMADGVSNGARRPRALLAASNFTPRVTAILLIILFIFLGWTFFWLLYAERQSMLSARRQALSDQLTSALSVGLYFEGQMASGAKNELDAKHEALAILNNLRYGEMNSGYFFVISSSGILLAHPLRPDLVNTSLSRMDDRGAQTFIVNLLKSIRQHGRGFLTYSWEGRRHRPGPRLAPGVLCTVGTLGLGASLPTLPPRISTNASRGELSQQVLLLIVLSAILALVLSSTLRRLVLAGVDRLILLAQRLQAGDLSARAFSTGADELQPAGHGVQPDGGRASSAATNRCARPSAHRCYALAKLAEARDNETGGHLLRVREYSVLLAGALRDHPRFAEIVDDAFLDDLYDATMLHDIGKVAIPDHILLKPDVLDEGEMAIMMSHTLIGANTIRARGAR